MYGLIKVTPNKEKAKAILKMAETSLEMVGQIDNDKYPSNVTKEYYDIIRELISTILLLDGYKPIAVAGSHKILVEYMSENYKDLTGHEVSIVDELRGIRNRISYDGFFVTPEYLNRNVGNIKNIIAKLKNIIKTKLGEV